MKVLFINTVDGKGSTGNLIRQIGARLEARGHEYQVAFGRYEARDKTHAYRIGSNFGVNVHALLSKLTDRAGFYSGFATRKLIKFIEGYQPDVIHLHNLHGYYVKVPMLFDYLKKHYGGKVVWTLHDCWAFTGHCAYYTLKQCEKWKSQCHHCPLKNQFPASIVLDQSRRNFADKKRAYQGLPKMQIVTVSEWLAGEVRQSILKDYPVRAIHNGIDTKVFHPHPMNIREKYGVSADAVFVVSVSDGWDYRKGLWDIVNIANQKPDYRFLVVGLDPNQTDGLPTNIKGLLRTENKEELVAMYSEADVFLNPSREETFGLVTAEALSCGTPVAVYDTTACPEIPDASSGMVVEAFDWQKMSDAVTHIAKSGQFTRQACRDRALRCFTIEQMTEEYCKLYEE